MNNDQSLQTIKDLCDSTQNINNNNNPENVTNLNNNNTNNNQNNLNKPSSQKSSKKPNLILSRNIRWFIFIILLLISIMVSMDHGTIPAATVEIKESLKQGDDVLGLFGSLVFFGNIIGIYFN